MEPIDEGNKRNPPLCDYYKVFLFNIWADYEKIQKLASSCKIYRHLSTNTS